MSIFVFQNLPKDVITHILKACAKPNKHKNTVHAGDMPRGIIKVSMDKERKKSTCKRTIYL
jgi:hypothetical protein